MQQIAQAVYLKSISEISQIQDGSTQNKNIIKHSTGSDPNDI